MEDRVILVVDDEEPIRNLLKQAMSRAGFEVKTAASAEDAVELLEKEPVYVMFFDLNLPGMDGIELCRKTKKMIPMSIAYAITGYASLFELAECREAGFEDYFKKPCNIKQLSLAAEQAFEKLERWKKN